MLARDYVARLGRVHYETRQVYAHTHRLGEIQAKIGDLKKQRVRTDALADVYRERIATAAPPWFSEPMRAVYPTAETRQALSRALGLYGEYYDELAKKKRIDADISRQMLIQYTILRDVDELRVSIASSIAELGSLTSGLSPDGFAGSGGPDATVAAILQRAHACLADSAKLADYLGGMPSGDATAAPPAGAQ